MKAGHSTRGTVSLAAALGLVLAIVGTACTHSSSSGTNSVSNAASLLRSSPTRLPDADPSGFQRILSGLRGKPLVVNVWASWCPPCEREAPALAQAAREFSGKVQFVGVDVLDQRSPAVAFIWRHGWTYPSVFEPQASIRNDLGFQGQPVTVIYDANGKSVYTISGPGVSLGLLKAQFAKLGI
jgi:thiol-disulfide isomerase/thioredoxin